MTLTIAPGASHTADRKPVASPDRAAAATLACVARFGLTKLTVDDVAREVGCSRATLYRAFPSKRALVESAVAREADRIVAVVSAAGTAAATLDDAVTDVIVVGARELRSVAALTFLADHEPEVLHPHLSFAGGDRFYAAAARRLAPVFARWCADPERAAEWVVRLGLTLVWSAHPPVDAGDPAAMHAYVSTFVTPGMRRNDDQ